MDNIYDSIVIGSGAMGSAAAYAFAKSGQKTLLLEQFTLDHAFGSSYGASRIIRYAYDHPLYIALVKASYPLWRALESESGETLLVQTGGFDFGIPDYPLFAAVRQSLVEMNIPFEDLSSAEAARRFPQFRLDDDMTGLFQPDAGLLKASLCVRTLVRMARQYGTTFIDNCAVERIIPAPEGVVVQTAQGNFSASRLVICAGSWTSKLLSPLGVNLPLQPTREQLFFFDCPPEYNAGKMPIFINWSDDFFYGISGVDGSGLKVSQHSLHDPVDVDTVNRSTDTHVLERVRRFMRKHLPAAADAPLKQSRVCLYTMSPDEQFVLDHHPLYPNIVFGAGFSGHGFKFSVLIGKLLADMASGNRIDFDLSLFKAGRFASAT